MHGKALPDAQLEGLEPGQSGPPPTPGQMAVLLPCFARGGASLHELPPPPPPPPPLPPPLIIPIAAAPSIPFTVW